MPWPEEGACRELDTQRCRCRAGTQISQIDTVPKMTWTLR